MSEYYLLIDFCNTSKPQKAYLDRFNQKSNRLLESLAFFSSTPVLNKSFYPVQSANITFKPNFCRMS